MSDRPPEVNLKGIQAMSTEVEITEWVGQYAKEHLIGHRRTGKCRGCVFARHAEESYFAKGRWCSVRLRNKPSECRAWQHHLTTTKQP